MHKLNKVVIIAVFYIGAALITNVMRTSGIVSFLWLYSFASSLVVTALVPRSQAKLANIFVVTATLITLGTGTLTFFISNGVTIYSLPGEGLPNNYWGIVYTSTPVVFVIAAVSVIALAHKKSKAKHPRVNSAMV